MNLSSYIKEIRQKGERSFSISQLMSDLNLSKNAALNAIARIKEHGDLISPARGLYVIVPPEHQPYGSIPAEELVPILMKYLDAEYYVSLLSAASFYGATHQKSARFQIMTNRRIKHPLEFGQVQLEIIHKQQVSSLPTQDFTVSTGYLKVASPELTVFDLLNYPARSGGLNHIATVLSELISAVDSIRLLAFADLVNQNAWIQRLGYILEKIDTMEEDKRKGIIEKLQEYVCRKKPVFVPLASELPKSAYPRIRKWKIIENTNVESDL